MQDIVIFGTHGFASELQQLIEDLASAGEALRCTGYIIDDAYRKQDIVRDLPVFDGQSEALLGATFAVGVGATAARKRIVQDIESRLRGRFLTLKHPRAWIGRRVELGTGCIVCAGAHVTADISVGDHSQLHVGCTIGHDTVIDSFVTIAPGANVSGRVRIKEGAFIGAGAVILPDIQIGAWATVGAGAVVTKMVSDHATVAGVPARILRSR